MKAAYCDRTSDSKAVGKTWTNKEQLTISKGVIWKIAQNYTKEAGVRQMEREIGNICRKLPERSMNMIKREFR